MPPSSPLPAVSVQPGAHLIGTAFGPFTISTRASKSGKPLSFVEGTVLAGMTIVKVSHKVESDEKPWLPEHGDAVHAAIVPDWKTNGVLVVDAVVQRPVISK